jgi:hypothetical protein
MSKKAHHFLQALVTIPNVRDPKTTPMSGARASRQLVARLR